MRRRLWLLPLAVLAAALGVASARAAGPGTTTTGTTTTGTTTTGTTTTGTTTTPAYTPLSLFSFPTGCVGAGAAALLPPSHPPIALGTPSAGLGPFAYPASGSVLTFASSAQSGGRCKSGKVTLSSVSLFGGAVTASSVEATDGRGSVTGLAIDGSAATATAGQTVRVDGWGQVTLGATVGRVTAPLVLRLLHAHGSLPAGTAVAIAFAAAPHVAKSAHRGQGSTGQKQGIGSARSPGHSGGTKQSGKHRQPQKPPPDFPATPYHVVVDGHLAQAAQHDPVVSLATQYLGIRYTWGGASPKTGFDCSGLVKYVFGKLGVDLPHFAASQWRTPYGVWVAPNRLQPGDLVFFVGSDGTRKEPGHVGIYVGDGYLIDAPHTGAFVRIDSLKERSLANGYVGARRITSPLRDARHLFHVTEPEVLTTGFQPRISLEPLGEPFAVAALGAPAIQSASRDYWIWVGAAAACLLVLSLGGLAAHRRRAAVARQGTLDFRQQMR